MTLYDDPYLNRLRRALACGRPDCPCALGEELHCPAHHHAHIPNLTIDGPPDNPTFTCGRGCDEEAVIQALAARALTPPSRILTSTDALEVGLKPLSSIISQPIDWLWPGLIPLRALTLIAGHSGSGKTAIALDLAARASNGDPAPGGTAVSIACVPVLIASLAHPSPAPFIHYLESLGADTSHIYLADLLDPITRGDGYGEDDHDENSYSPGDPIPHPALLPLWTSPLPSAPKPPTAPREPTLQDILDRLAAQARTADADLIIVDQIEHLAAPYGVRPYRVLAKLNLLAQRTGAAVVAFCDNPADTLSAARRAARAYAPIPRAILATARLAGGVRALLPVTSSAPPIPYRLGERSLQWGGPVSQSSLEALAAPNDPRPSPLDSASSLLDSMLADGPRPAAEIKHAAANLGISSTTLFRARRVRNVRSIKTSGPEKGPGKARWYWQPSTPGAPIPAAGHTHHSLPHLRREN